MSPERQLIREAARNGIRFVSEPGGIVMDYRKAPADYVELVRSVADDLRQKIVDHVAAAPARGDRFIATLKQRISQL